MFKKILGSALLSFVILPCLAFAAADIYATSVAGKPGDTVSVYVYADTSVAVNSLQFNFQFDPKLLQFSSITYGNNNVGWTIVSNPNNTSGIAMLGMFNTGGSPSSVPAGQGEQVALIKFTVNNPPGDSSTNDPWIINGVDFDTVTGVPQINVSNSFSLNVPPPTYTLITNISGGGTVTANPQEANYPAGTQVVLTEVPNANNVFINWSGVICSEGNQISSTCTTVINANTSVLASFSALYTISAATTGGGSILCGYSNNQPDNCPANFPSYLVTSSQPMYFVAYAPVGSVLSSWGGACAGASLTPTQTTPENIYQCAITSLTSNVTVLASFALQTETITVSTGSGGTISPSGTVSIKYGASQTFTLTPNAGNFAALTVDGNAVTLTNNTYAMTNIIASHQVTASFSPQVISPDGSTLTPNQTGQSLKTSAGTWTFSPLLTSYGNVADLNGASAAGGSGIELLVYNSGKMYITNKQGGWYIWNGTGWAASSNPVPPSIPAIPTNLAATASSSSQVNLSWTASVGATGYSVYRNGTKVGTSTTNSYSDTGLAASTTYAYAVAASNSTGSSAQSGAVSATTPAAPVLSPDGSTLTPNQTGQSLTTSAGTWTFSPLLTSYGNVADLNGASAAGGSGIELLVYNSGKIYITNKQGGWYMWNGSGWTASSNPLPPSKPAVPTNLAATAVSSSQVNLSWTASLGATSYTIYRNSTQVATSTTNSYSDTGLAASSTYSYMVSATNSTGSSAQTSAVSATTPAGQALSPDGSILTPSQSGSLITSAGTWTFSPLLTSYGNVVDLNGASAAGGSGIELLVYNGGKMYISNKQGGWYVWNGSGWTASSNPLPPSIPAVPANLVATAVSSSQVNLSWTVSLGATSYTIYRNGTQVATSTTNSYSNTGLAASSTYSYMVSATNSTGSSAQTSAVSATTPAAPVISADGSTLIPSQTGQFLTTSAGKWTFGAATPYGNTVDLNGAVAGGGSGIELLVYNSGKMYLTNNSGGWFVWNGTGWTATSNPQPVVIPPVPTNLQASAVAFSQVNLTWSPSVGAASYSIFRNGTQVGTSTTAAYSDLNLSASTTYTYAVAATNTAGSSAQTATVSAVTPVAPPISLDGSTLTAKQTTSLVTSAGIWTFSQTFFINGVNAIMLNGQNPAGAYGVLMLVYNKSQLYVESSNGSWWMWNGSIFIGVYGDPRLPQSVSPDGSTLVPGQVSSLETSAGTWTFSQTFKIDGMPAVLLNNSSQLAAGNAGTLMVVDNHGQLYLNGGINGWWLWEGTGWVSTPGDPRQ